MLEFPRTALRSCARRWREAPDELPPTAGARRRGRPGVARRGGMSTPPSRKYFLKIRISDILKKFHQRSSDDPACPPDPQVLALRRRKPHPARRRGRRPRRRPVAGSEVCGFRRRRGSRQLRFVRGAIRLRSHAILAGALQTASIPSAHPRNPTKTRKNASKHFKTLPKASKSFQKLPKASKNFRPPLGPGPRQGTAGR
jgi:hypothetical protein